MHAIRLARKSAWLAYFLSVGALHGDVLNPTHTRLVCLGCGMTKSMAVA